MKGGESLEQGLLGSRRGHCAHRARGRVQCPNDAGGPGATLRGRSLAPQRPQPGCELGLRRTLLAAPGCYSLCLWSRAAAVRQPVRFRFPFRPNIASQTPTSHWEGFPFSLLGIPWDSENRKENELERCMHLRTSLQEPRNRVSSIMPPNPSRGDAPHRLALSLHFSPRCAFPC